MFFTSEWFGAPKEMVEFLKKIKTLSTSLSDEQIEKIKSLSG
jgi:hypothetical protein